jgi:hypothetical protein
MARIYIPRSFDYRSLDTPVTSGFLSPAQMENHSIARVRCSVIAGVDLALFKSKGFIRRGTSVKRAGAVAQDDRGTMSYHASHPIPCSLLANGIPLHTIQELRNIQGFVLEPYRVTNILPRSANLADSRAERSDAAIGKQGLAKNFERFCQRILDTSTAFRGKVDRGSLLVAFEKLIQDYCESFELALSSTRDVAIGRITTVPGVGVEIDPSVKYTDKDFEEDNVRTALQTQLKPLKELGLTVLSPVLVEQIESDFHSLPQESKS